MRVAFQRGAPLVLRCVGRRISISSLFSTRTEKPVTSTARRSALRPFAFACVVLFASGIARADRYTDTIALFKSAGDSSKFFGRAYAYAVFPLIGEGGLIGAAAHGTGRVYQGGAVVGHTSMTQLSIGFQAGGKAYSEIIFFEDKRSLDEFESGSFEFDAGASAIAVTASANAQAGTNGAESGASAGEKDARTDSAGYNKGVAVFTIAKGGLMYAVAIAGQKFTYTPGAQ
jgi:lipid-binding SYLF domain-containing protein